MSRPIVIGMDVGSTTVKAVVVDPATKEILWHDYQRHHTKQPETVLDFLVRIGQAFDEVEPSDIRLFVTGSGAGPLAEPTGGRFVQEVNAVTMAVEDAPPRRAGSVIELGGQDAKIIIFKDQREDRRPARPPCCSMNDKCASGTGATIDKCMIKVGMPLRGDVAELHFDDSACTTWPPSAGSSRRPTSSTWSRPASRLNEIMCSLADAIVMQNLSVLTRGNTLRAEGAPARRAEHLPAVPAGVLAPAHPGDVGGARLSSIDKDEARRGADLRARQLPVLRRLRRGPCTACTSEAGAGLYQGWLDGLQALHLRGRKARLGENAGPPLVLDRRPSWRHASSSATGCPSSKRPAKFEPAQVVRAVIGLDGGSTSSKACCSTSRATS